VIATKDKTAAGWTAGVIKRDEITRYLLDGKEYIDDALIESKLAEAPLPEAQRVRDIIAKSLAIETLSPDETALLLQVKEPALLAEMEEAAGRIKKKVYDNRIVTFAPLYLSTYCVNNCSYCGLRHDNDAVRRRRLDLDEIEKEVEILAGTIGHKRLVVVYGEHKSSDADYIVTTMETIYGVSAPTRKGEGRIRRVNVNAAPMSVADLKRVKEAGLGTFQVFQETYHHGTYARVHPAGTPKADYAWRAYAMHRAMEAGIDDVGIGALFGLYDWRFEVMGLLYHAIELERAFGIGPHTISFPRLEPAANTPFVNQTGYHVSDADFRRAITVIRLAVPYTGMILTARENAQMRRDLLPLGITQTDASSKIGVGAYSDEVAGAQSAERQQFLLGDTRSLDVVVRELARMGNITSFCTAGYRCGRTGKCIMELLRSGREGMFCKLNAVLTFREWLDDFASEETIAAGEPVIEREIGEIRAKMPDEFEGFCAAYRRICKGERDLCF
jgi:2-iminoacetate synthase